MDRRSFLFGTSAGIGAAALGGFVKLAPTPIVESIEFEPMLTMEEWAERILNVGLQPWQKEVMKAISEGNPYKTLWVEDRFEAQIIPRESLYA